MADASRKRYPSSDDRSGLLFQTGHSYFSDTLGGLSASRSLTGDRQAENSQGGAVLVGRIGVRGSISNPMKDRQAGSEGIMETGCTNSAPLQENTVGFPPGRKETPDVKLSDESLPD